MKTLTSPTLWELAVPYLASFVGSLVVAIGMNAFFIPFQLLSSGLSGIAIMFYFLTGLPVGIGIFILNIPIMIACYKFMGRSYTVLSIVGTIMLSVLVDVTSFLSTWNIMHDAMLSSITGGILSGIGFAHGHGIAKAYRLKDSINIVITIGTTASYGQGQINFPISFFYYIHHTFTPCIKCALSY